MIDVGNVFSNTIKMMKERWLLMIALWAAFFGALMLYALIFGGLVGGSLFATIGSFADPSALDNPAALGGLGFGFIIMLLVFYVGYFAIAFGQQASMVAMASPLERIGFGEAFGRGIRGGITFLGVMVLLILGYIVFVLIAALLGIILSFLGDAAPALVAILFFPAIIYLLLRFSVLVPVIVVEKTFNPITALNRTWQATGGKVLGIFVVYLVFAAIAFIMVALPFMVLFGSLFASLSAGSAPDVTSMIGTVFVSGIIFLVVFMAFAVFSSALTASLHAEVSDSQAVDLGKTFE